MDRSSQRISSLLLLVLGVFGCCCPCIEAFSAVRPSAVVRLESTTTRCQAAVNKRVSKGARTSRSMSESSPSNNASPSFFKPFWEQPQSQSQSQHNALTPTRSIAPSTSGTMDFTGFLRSGTEKQKAPSPVADFENNSQMDPEKQFLLPALALLIAAGAATTASTMGWTVTDVASALESFVANPQAVLNGVVDGVQAMGPAGPFYFGLFYLVAEVLAVPATPLALSAGYLFGLTQGVGIVLTAATIAACIAFFVGKTFLRSWVEGILAENPKFAKLDTAIGEQGFKLLVLVRLSPIFPFALSNYVYGASSIGFSDYFWGTLLGFTPGTIAYVYTGMVGKELMLGSGSGQPWYVYAGIFGALLTFLKLVTDVSSGIVEAVDDEESA